MTEQQAPTSSSCAGACCAVFPIDGWQVERMRRNDPKTDPERAYILDMLIPLTYDEGVARLERLGYGPPPEAWPDREFIGGPGGMQLFTCRHWNEETRLCGAYDARPNMCRNYPYGSPCERKCGYEYDPKAKSDPSPFVWDAAVNGWRLESNAKWTWSPDEQVIRANASVKA